MGFQWRMQQEWIQFNKRNDCYSWGNHRQIQDILDVRHGVECWITAQEQGVVVFQSNSPLSFVCFCVAITLTSIAMSGLPAILKATEEDIKLLLSAQSHLGTKNCDVHMEPYVWKRRADGKGLESR